MNILWIIGNGFDLNYGAKTSYKSFLNDVYLNDDIDIKGRDQLLEKLKDNKLDDRNHWADLEVLLGDVSICYSNNEEEFHDTFDEMEHLFIDYVAKSEKEIFIKRPLTKEVINEFYISRISFQNRLVPVDQDKLARLRSVSERIVYNFICLNYTHIFDAFLDKAKLAHKPFNRRQVVTSSYEDIANDPLHIHGQIINGIGREIVFGVSNENQIENKEYSTSELFLENWVKENRNSSIYGNKNTAVMHELIRNADIICIYGCSLGLTDIYIWSRVAGRIVSNQNSRLIYFAHNLPDRSRQNVREYQRSRDALFNKLTKVSGETEGTFNHLRSRTIFAQSNLIFRF